MKVSSSVVLEAENFSNDVSFVSEEFPRDFKRKRAIGPLGFRTLNKKIIIFLFLGKTSSFILFIIIHTCTCCIKTHIILSSREESLKKKLKTTKDDRRRGEKG